MNLRRAAISGRPGIAAFVFVEIEASAGRAGRNPMIRFKCAACGEWHEGTPGYAAEAPLFYYSIPLEERAERCVLDSDTCVVDEKFFFVRSCLEIPVHGESEPFIWGVWVSLNDNSFRQFMGCFEALERSHIGPSSVGSPPSCLAIRARKI